MNVINSLFIAFLGFLVLQIFYLCFHFYSTHSRFLSLSLSSSTFYQKFIRYRRLKRIYFKKKTFIIRNPKDHLDNKYQNNWKKHLETKSNRIEEKVGEHRDTVISLISNHTNISTKKNLSSITTKNNNIYQIEN